MNIKQITDCQHDNQHNLLDKANVVSVGYGYKIREGETTIEECLMVGVTKKVDVAALSKRDAIPSKIGAVTTDVVELGLVKAQASTDKFRPAMPGISIGHKNITAGTFGCVVRKGNTRYILSNNHVLANSNNAKIGDAIFQPGPHDGGTSLDQLATLDDFVRIVFPGDDSDGGNGGGNKPTCPFAKGAAKAGNFVARTLKRNHRLMAVNPQEEINHVDAAIALPINDADIIEDITQIGAPAGVAEATLGMDVQKYGRTTQYTTGKVLQLHATVKVNYGPGKLATFVDQIVTGAMSEGGDSGSAVLDMNKNVVGLLYAGSSSSTILNPIQIVFDKLGVTL